MKIINAEVIVCSPGRNFVTLKIETDSGIYGLGDATLNGRELAVATYLQEHLIPCIIDRDPFDSEDIWQYLYRGVYWRRGAVNMTAIGAIDMALWDIKGKALDVPVYKLLGGKSRHRLLGYTHAQGKDTDETLQKISDTLKKGFKAVRVQSGIPGIEKIYGIAKDEGAYEPAIKGSRPDEETWNTEKYLNHIPKLFQRVRKEFGEDVQLLHDAHHRLTPIEAARLGKELEPFHLFWLEDTVAAENQEGFEIIRRHTTTPLAVGEIFNTIYDCHHLITTQSIDYIRMTVAHGGGLTPMLKVANLASIYHVRTGCHGPSDLSPINLAACLHFGTAVNNFGIQEYMGYDPQTSNVFSFTHRFEDGHFIMNDEAGLGVDFDFEKVKNIPYKQAFLPVNRLEDGTLYHW
ncbi:MULTISPECIES: D-mannonate dehydratase ManD [Flavobacteriaceae]|uniref:D-mannonate dehydratase ManD n=1 Tax=Flavobacteriaceae TaxID=49546 RepID=UPI001492FE46|nr:MULTISPECIES: D-mannonate dehydratase ManD [Allomuricauda]MDC6367320.1 D-galactonate dehydratase family protein [Muricauda sp. AC10]